MFSLLRSWIKPITYISLVAFLGTIVLAWGMDISNSNKPGALTAAAGIVNGEEVTRVEYNNSYQNVRSQQFGNSDVQPTAADLQRIKEQAWANVVAQKALEQEMDRMEITVSDDEVYTYLRLNPPAFMRSQPQFQTDGQFDYNRYLQIMAEPTNAPMWAQVEQVVRPQVRTSLIQEIVTSTARITQDEVKSSYLSFHELAKFGFVAVSSASFADSLVEVSESEINEYYNSHLYRFKSADRRGIRLALFSKDISEEDWELVRVECQQYADSARLPGRDFGELAKGRSEGPSATQGGDLGYYATTSLDPLYVAGALAIEIGATTDPVRSSFGWHIIKLLGMKDKDDKETTDSEKAVTIHTAHLLLKVVASDATINNAERHARDFHILAGQKGFQAAADELGVELKETAPFRRNDAINFLGTNYFATEWAFNAEQGAYSGIYDNEANFFVMELNSIKAEGNIPLKDVRASVESLAKNEKLNALCLDTARAIYEEIKGGMDIAEAARAHNQSYVETTKISRRSAFPTPIGADPRAIGGAFNVKDINGVSAPIAIDRGAAIFKLIEKESPGLDEFNVASDSVAAALLSLKQNSVWQTWYSQLILAAESENFMERQIADQRTIVIDTSSN